jgi:hypothetical protein
LVVETNRYYHDYTYLTMDILFNLILLKQKYLCFWHWQHKWHMAKGTNCQTAGNSLSAIHTFYRTVMTPD